MTVDETKLRAMFKAQSDSLCTEFSQMLELQLAKAFGQFFSYFDKRLKEELDPLRGQFNQMQNTLNGFVGRLSTDEEERAALCNGFDRYDRWIHEVADHTDTQLSPP